MPFGSWFKSEGDALYCPQVLSYVLALVSVAPCRAFPEHAVLVNKLHGKAVHLRLQCVFDVAVYFEVFFILKSKARTSSSERALARLSMGTVWVTVPNSLRGSALSFEWESPA